MLKPKAAIPAPVEQFVMTDFYYVVSADMDCAPLSVIFSGEALDMAQKKKQEWLDDLKIFNVVLYKVTKTWELI